MKRMKEDSLYGYGFSVPNIRAFQEPNLLESQKTDSEWER